jgi:ribonuclease VapC
MRILDTLPIEIVPADRELAKLAAEIKLANKVSFADCFAAAVARQQKAELITGDKEFRALEGQVLLFL